MKSIFHILLFGTPKMSQYLTHIYQENIYMCIYATYIIYIMYTHIYLYIDMNTYVYLYVCKYIHIFRKFEIIEF